MSGGAFETHESRVARLAHNAKAARTLNSYSTPHHAAPALLRGCRALPAEAAQIELQGSEEPEERGASQLELPTPAGSLLIDMADAAAVTASVHRVSQHTKGPPHFGGPATLTPHWCIYRVPPYESGAHAHPVCSRVPRA